MNEWIPNKMPEDLDAERSLLATITCNALQPDDPLSAEVHTVILSCQPAYFVNPPHRAIFKAIQSLYQNTQNIDVLSIKAEMERQNTLDKIGGSAILFEIVGFEYQVFTLFPLLERLKELYQRRAAFTIASRLVNDARDATIPMSETINKTLQALTNLVITSNTTEFISARRVIELTQTKTPFKDLQNGDGKLAFFGIPCLDNQINAEAGNVITIGAAPGVGKSALLAQIQCNSAKRNIVSALISLEMTEWQVLRRYAACLTEEHQENFKHGTWSAQADEWLNLYQSDTDNFGLYDLPSHTQWTKIEAQIREAVRVQKAKLILIDHVLLIGHTPTNRNVSEASRYAEISRSIKRLAKELNVCFVNACQFQKADLNGEPSLASLKESGAWAEDSDTVLLFWNKNQAQEGEEQPFKPIMVKAAKVRDGSSGWKKELALFGKINKITEFVDYNAENSMPQTTPSRWNS